MPLLATAVLTKTIWACWYILGWRKMALLNGTRGDNIQENWLSTVMFIRICGHHQMREIRTHLHIAFKIRQLFLEQRNVMCKRVPISYTWGWLHSIRSLSQQINIVVARQHSCMSSPFDQLKKRRFLVQIPLFYAIIAINIFWALFISSSVHTTTIGCVVFLSLWQVPEKMAASEY